MTFLDNNDALFLFGNNSNNPYAFHFFNDIMRQYYDSNGNPIKQQQQTSENTSENENENREIVSSVQPIAKRETTNTNTNRTTGKRDTLTLDLLLPKCKSNNAPTSSYSYPYCMKEAGEEVLASEHQGKQRRRGDKNNFDIRDYISSIYNYHNRQQQPQQPQQPQQQRQQQQENQKHNNNDKLTLAHLLNGRQPKTRTFIFTKASDY